MITDNIKLLKRYAVPRTEAILNFIAEHEYSQISDGETEIEGRELFVRIMSYVPKPAAENRFEIHRIYADVQYIVNGAELMQTARMKDLTPIGDYVPKEDYQFFNNSGATTDVIVQADEFVVFYPGQAHRPACLWQGHQGMVKKLVFKVKIN